jgi:histidinol-phosphate aminotransferase
MCSFTPSRDHKPGGSVAVSRRDFLATVGAGGAALGAGGAGILADPFITWRGREALFAQQAAPPQGAAARRADRRMAAAPGMIRIDSNENPIGPGKHVLDAMRAAFDASNRYPVVAEDDVISTIAKIQGVSAENVALGCGSGELLRACDQAFVSKEAAFVGAGPTFEAIGDFAKVLGAEVRAPRVDSKLRLDLGAMGAAAKGAGLIFLCNPNNPTGTVHTKADVAAFIADVNRASPMTTILVDEAYFEYVENPGYGTMIPLSIENPRVVVLRTFSKVFGMAGLRLGYMTGRPETLAKVKPWIMGSNVSALTLAAGVAALNNPAHIAAEVKRNKEVKAYTRKFFGDLGYTMSEGEANFMMVDLKTPIAAFKRALVEKKVAIGRAFPPLDTQARITFGTMEEMKRALPVIRDQLAATRTAGAGEGRG